jgi:hypothetical protein
MISILCIPLCVVFIYYYDPVMNFFQDHSEYIAALITLAFLFKMISKLIFALAFVPIGTFAKFIVAISSYSAIECALIYNSISILIEEIAFFVHRRYTKIPEELKKSKGFIKLKEKLESWNLGKTEDSEIPKFWIQFLEIFFIQNAFGVPDTATMLYYAILTRYSSWAFYLGTTISYFSVNLVKNYAWMIAFKAIRHLKSFKDLSNLSSSLSKEETYVIIAISSIGIIWIIYKLCLSRRASQQMVHASSEI